MTRPAWAWKCPEVKAQLDRMAGHAGYELWRCGVQCGEALDYDAEDRILGELLDAAVARGEPASACPSAPGAIPISHRLYDGQLLEACVFTASHIIDGLPVLRGSLCVTGRWYGYARSGIRFITEEYHNDGIRNPVPIPAGWRPLSEETEMHVRHSGGKSDAMRAMEHGARRELEKFAAQVEVALRAKAQKEARAVAERDALAAWEAR